MSCHHGNIADSVPHVTQLAGEASRANGGRNINAAQRVGAMTRVVGALLTTDSAEVEPEPRPSHGLKVRASGSLKQ